MTDKDFMAAAIDEAKRSHEPIPCGVVIVKDGKIVAKAHNNQRRSFNASSHAEINAIRKAGRTLGDKNLRECTIYCTCEPCTMCLSAIIFAKIGKMVYGVSLKDIDKNLTINIETDYFLSKTKHKLKVSKKLHGKRVYGNLQEYLVK